MRKEKCEIQSVELRNLNLKRKFVTDFSIKEMQKRLQNKLKLNK